MRPPAGSSAKLLRNWTSCLIPAIGVESEAFDPEKPASANDYLATAHPAKFSEAIKVAGLDLPGLPALPADVW